MKPLFFLLWALCNIVPLSLPAENARPKATQSENDILPPALAKELKQAEEAGDSRFFGEFMNMLVTLGGIVIVIMIFMWILKKMLNVRVEQVNKTSSIKILEKRIVTPKTTIYVLGVFGKAVAIAESMNGVTLLSEISLKEIRENRGLAPEKINLENEE